MDVLRQTLAVCNWSFRTLPSRARSVSVIVLGFFAVVLVFVAVLSIRDGLRQGMRAPNLDSVAFVYGRSGDIDESAATAVAEAPGVAQSAQGPLVSGTVSTTVEMPNWRGSVEAQATLRGVDGKFPLTLPDFRLLSGRMFQPGLNEIVVGEVAARLYPNLSLGSSVEWNKRSWKVVGIYRTGSNLRDSSLLTDVGQLQTLTGSVRRYSALYVRLTSADAFDAFNDALQNDPRLAVQAERLESRDAASGEMLNDVIETVNRVITFLMAVGAIFGALNIMYADVARRKGQIATLRSLGFARTPILISVLLESLSFALLGGGLGIVVAFLLFDGLEVSTSTGSSLFGFEFAVTRSSIVAAIALTLGMGFLGGLFPAVKAARTPVARALREA